MKNILAIVFAVALVGCSDPMSQWKSTPLNPAIDFTQMREQIKANPAEWSAALKFLKEVNLNTIELGRHDLTEKTFANVQEYISLTEGKYEAHRKYIDLQVVISGNENIFVAPLGNAINLVHDYDESVGDYVLFADAKNPKTIPANPESWVILFPNDAHKPGMAIGDPAPIRKVVIKIPFAE